MIRLFFATDVHGSERCFKKFINAGKFYKVNVLILGGDLSGKMIVPIVKQADQTFTVDFLGNEYVLKTREEVNEMENRIREIGYYPYYTTPKEIEDLLADKARLNELFLQLIVERLNSWMRMAEERLRNTGIKIYITGGNDDPFAIEDVLNSSDYIVNPQDKVVKIDEYHEMISSGFSNPTPWKTPREITENELMDKIEAMIMRVKDVRSCIFNLHVPPIDSNLDICPKLDTTVVPPKPVVKGGQIVTFGAGSIAVRQMIEKYQPLLGLFGHIHESRGVVKIGRTLCINPGSEYSEGILKGALIILDKGKIKSYQLTSG